LKARNATRPTRALLLALFCGAGLTLAIQAAEPANKQSWSQFRGDAAQRGVAGPLPEKLELLWQAEVAGGIEATAAIESDAQGRGSVYLGGLGGKFSAYDLETGAVKWTYDAGEEIKSSPLLAAGSLYFGDELGKLHALDAKTGKLRWSFTAEGPITGGPNQADGVLVVGSYDNRIYGLSAKDGKELWRLETGGYVNGTPAIAGKTVIASGCDGTLRLVDLKSGKQLAEVAVGTYVAASPAVDGNLAIFGTFDNDVVAFDLAKKAIAWRYKNPAREFPYYSSAALAGGLAVIGGRDKALHAIELKTGQGRWTKNFQARIDASPVAAGDRVYVADHAGVLAGFKLQDGTETWRYESGEDFAASPAVGGGKLLIGSVQGKLYAFGTPRKSP
jgi:eukaryotic-like serine/threonine-protein kinase